MNFLITNAETIKLIFNISLIIVAIGSVICLIAYLINKKCAKYICAQSTAIQNINNLNEKYKFNEIECMDVEHCYDNANFYGDISPTDFLIYQLTYTGAKAKTAITHAEENKRAYEEYCAGIALINKTDFDVPSLLKWYLRKKKIKSLMIWFNIL